MTKCKGQQLKLEDRVKLQTYLEEEIPIKIISNKLKVAKQTIYREIQRNGIIKKGNNYNNRIDCVNRVNCSYRTIGNRCNNKCTHYIKETCKKIVRFPFVCNTCEKRSHCNLEHQYYYANKANEKAKMKLSETRKGIKISFEDFQQIDAIISPLISEKHQSLNHILTEHKEIDCE